MIKHAYTARELAELQLDGWPQTLRAFQIKAQREGWVAQQRQASGGGQEFPFSTLPASLKKTIIERDVAGAAAMVNPLAGVEEAAAGIGAEDRRTAKLAIVTMFRQFQRVMGLGVVQAELPFIAHYRQQSALTPADMPFRVYADFSARSLHRWCKMADADPKALAGNYGGRKGTSTLNRASGGAVATYIAALICENSHYKAGHIRDLVRARFGEVLDVQGKPVALPSLRAFERHMLEWKTLNKQLHMNITAPGQFKNKMKVVAGDASARFERLNQQWQIDASPADALGVDGRYNIYAIIDIWSRRVLFSVSATPKTEASLMLVRRAIMEWGMPETIKTDNGADFISKRFKRALFSLGIGQEISNPHSPWEKGFVERVIKTVQHDLMVILPGFSGHNVAERKDITDQKDFAARLGESEKATFAATLTAEKLQEYLDSWAAGKYGQNIHSTLGMSPAAKAATWPHPVRRLADPHALDLLLAPIAGGDGFRTITRAGIRVGDYQYHGAGLIPHIKSRVLVRHDPSDLGRIYVFDEDENFIAEAVNPMLAGLDPVAFTAELQATQKANLREMRKALNKERRSLDRTKQADAILALHSAKKVTEFPRVAETYSTPALDEAAKAVSKAPVQEHSAEQTRRVADLAMRMRRAQEAQPEMSDEDRWFAKAEALEAKAADELTATEATWLSGAQTQHWYAPRKTAKARKAEALAHAAAQKETLSVGLSVSNNQSEESL